MAERIKISRYRERFINCASCRAAAAFMVMIDDKPFATTCARHQAVWSRRAKTRIESEDK